MSGEVQDRHGSCLSFGLWKLRQIPQMRRKARRRHRVRTVSTPRTRFQEGATTSWSVFRRAPSAPSTRRSIRFSTARSRSNAFGSIRRLQTGPRTSSASDSYARRASSHGSSTPTSLPSTISSPLKIAASSSWSSSKAARSRLSVNRKAGFRFQPPSRSSRSSGALWIMRTSVKSCIVTSSRRTSWCPPL